MLHHYIVVPGNTTGTFQHRTNVICQEHVHDLFITFSIIQCISPKLITIKLVKPLPPTNTMASLLFISCKRCQKCVESNYSILCNLQLHIHKKYVLNEQNLKNYLIARDTIQGILFIWMDCADEFLAKYELTQTFEIHLRRLM